MTYSIKLLASCLLGFAAAGPLTNRWNQSLAGHVTRCFDSKDVTTACDDLTDPSHKTPPMAELQINGKDFDGNNYFYGYLRAADSKLCSLHLRKIQSVMKNADQVCITGWGEMKHSDEISAHWESLETKNGRVVR